MTTKRIVVLALALVMAGLAAYGYLDYQRSQPCFNFTRDEMPAPVARYLCQYDQVMTMNIFGIDMLAVEGVGNVGLAIRDEAGRIVYFEDAEGNVLLDRRDEVPAEKGQTG